MADLLKHLPKRLQIRVLKGLCVLSAHFLIILSFLEVIEI
jgi:hypothetical protein